MKKTKILATYGPAIAKPRHVARLVKEGVDAFRVNCSYGRTNDFLAAARIIREGLGKNRYPVGLLFDIAGPKLRLDRFDGKLKVTKGKKITIRQGRSDISKYIVGVNHPAILLSIKKGEKVLMDDGQIAFEAVETGRSGVVLKALNSGTLFPGKGINLPGTAIKVPTLSDKDRDDIKTAVRVDCDYIALSFVRSPGDIAEARKLVKKLGGRQMIIAKLEKREAIDKLDAIIDEADGVMVARGDLGVELNPADLPGLQKKIIQRATEHSKMVIVATQMLESMRFNPRPTRAEVNDVATAVFDQADAVMLSAETATGSYPQDVVRTMREIIESAERHTGEFPGIGVEGVTEDAIPQAVARAVVHADRTCAAEIIFAFTSSGYTARLLSNLMPRQPILAITDDKKVMRRLSLSRSVYAIYAEQPKSFVEMFDTVNKLCKQYRLARRRQKVYVTGGLPLGNRVPTNMLIIHEVS